MKIIHLLFALFYISACSNSQTFPAVIQVKSKEGLERMMGTKLFVAKPAGYQYFKNLARLQRDEHTYIQVIELPGSNILDVKSKLTEEHIESQGAKVDELRHITYNGYEAIYQSGPSKKPGETKFTIIFGDRSFIVSILGVCKNSDKGGREELNKIMTSSFYDKSFELDPMELVSYTFDTSILPYKYAQSLGTALIYTPNGKDDIQHTNSNQSMMQFSTMEMPSFEKAKEFLNYNVSRLAVQNIKVSHPVDEDFLVNGNKAYAISMNLTSVHGNATSYQAILFNGSIAVYFIGVDGKGGNLTDKFREVVKSIRF